MKTEYQGKILRDQKILEIKKQLIKFYVLLMTLIYVFYFLIYFLIDDKFMAFYLLTGGVVLEASWLLSRKNLNVENYVKKYLIIAPLYCFYIFLQFFDQSVVSLVWLVPIPLGAYIFFTKREIILYSIYALFIIFSGIFVVHTVELNFTKYPQVFITSSDLFIILINIAIIGALVYLKDQIRELELLNLLENTEKIPLPVSINTQEIKNSQSLFDRIEHEMNVNQVFKDSSFNISKLSILLKVNNNYISKSIRYQGYSNFNNYINSYRIKYVLEMMNTNALEKVTLLYLYTEAGFVSQTTFNRAFKEQTESTPSEYLQKLNNNITSQKENELKT